jgi:hypothetical protein
MPGPAIENSSVLHMLFTVPSRAGYMMRVQIEKIQEEMEMITKVFKGNGTSAGSCNSCFRAVLAAALMPM